MLDQFPDPSTRDQENIGSCHAFGSVAVLEAAYYRRYKEHVKFAEEDVFLRRTILSGDAYNSFCANGTCSLEEGNVASVDIGYTRWPTAC